MSQIYTIKHTFLTQIYTFKHNSTPQIYTFKHNYMSQIYTFKHNCLTQIHTYKHNYMPQIYTIKHNYTPQIYTFKHNYTPQIYTIKHNYTPQIYTLHLNTSICANLHLNTIIHLKYTQLNTIIRRKYTHLNTIIWHRDTIINHPVIRIRYGLFCKDLDWEWHTDHTYHIDTLFGTIIVLKVWHPIPIKIPCSAPSDNCPQSSAPRPRQDHRRRDRPCLIRILHFALSSYYMYII